MFPIIRPMAKVSKIHTDKQPIRIHYIAEWLAHRGLKQVDILNSMIEAGFLDINKGTISKWCSGQMPSEKYLLVLADVMSIGPNDLFRDPDDDWLTALFRSREKSEKKRMRAMLEAAFPMKDGTNG